PMIGGNKLPPVEAHASIAAAILGEYPVFLAIGIVNGPVVTTFAVGLPEIEPNNALAKIAIFAAPSRVRPAIAADKSKKNSPAPDFCKKAPNNINTNTNEAATEIGDPHKPL